MTEGESAIDTIAVDPDARCRRCGYLLRGLNEPRCPECGREFDPDDPNSVRSAASDAMRRQRLAIGLIPICVWIAVCLLLAVVWMWSGAVNDWMLGVPVASIVFFATLARSRARAALLGRKPDPAKWSERTAKFLLYGFCIVLFLTAGGIASWNCPHGTAIGIGHLGIAHSAVGGPCRNRLPHLKSWHLGGNWYVWHAWRFRR